MLRAGVVGLAVVLAGCVPMAAPDVVVANVPLVSSDGASIGAVRVFQENTGVVLRIDAKGLPPTLPSPAAPPGGPAAPTGSEPPGTAK